MIDSVCLLVSLNTTKSSPTPTVLISTTFLYIMNYSLTITSIIARNYYSIDSSFLSVTSGGTIGAGFLTLKGRVSHIKFKIKFYKTRKPQRILKICSKLHENNDINILMLRNFN